MCRRASEVQGVQPAISSISDFKRESSVGTAGARTLQFARGPRVAASRMGNERGAANLAAPRNRSFTPRPVGAGLQGVNVAWIAFPRLENFTHGPKGSRNQGWKFQTEPWKIQPGAPKLPKDWATMPGP